MANRRREPQLDSFTRAYIEAMLWSTTDESDEQGGEPLDKNYGPEDIAPETMQLIVEDCADFQKKFDELIADDDSPEISKWGSWELAGHDFALTRAGAGAGFWDGGWPKHGDELTEAAESYGNFDLVVGDDGEIHYASSPEYYRSHRKTVRPTATETRRRPGRRARELPYANPPAAPSHLIARDFSTLPEVVEHARRMDGATHVVLGDPDTRLYFPARGGGYTEAAVWHEHGYWHAAGPNDRHLVRALPAGAERITATMWRAERPRAAESAHHRTAAGGSTRRTSTQMSDEVMKIARTLSSKVGGGSPAYIGSHRWSDANESAYFVTFSPEQVQKVVVLVSVFADSTISLDFFSDEKNRFSESDRYESIGNFLYRSADYGEMVADLKWVWETVDGYAASWREDEGEMDERRRSVPRGRRVKRPPPRGPSVRRRAR